MLTKYEQQLLDSVDEKVAFCIYRGIDNNYIANQLDDVIYNLPDDSSPELLSILYRIQDNLLMGNDILNIF